MHDVKKNCEDEKRFLGIPRNFSALIFISAGFFRLLQFRFRVFRFLDRPPVRYRTDSLYFFIGNSYEYWP